MLQTQTVEPSTFTLLKRLMELDCLKQFSLVGGTALSLKFGHRLSVDLDLFCEENFDNTNLIQCLRQEFKDKIGIENSVEKFGIFCFIDEVKIDIVKHKHPLLKPIEIVDGVRMYSNEDIVAMKINAILGRGKKKDFWDLYALLDMFSLKEIINLYETKFSEQRLLISIPSAITYFDDANNSDAPTCLNNLSWDDVKKKIRKVVNEYLK